MLRITLLLAAIFALAVGSAVAPGCVPTTSRPEATAAGLYVVAKPFCAETCLFDLWVYQEANGIGGLQRQDEVHDDTCNGQIESDRVIV